jgi:hypothetical protein
VVERSDTTGSCRAFAHSILKGSQRAVAGIPSGCVSRWGAFEPVVTLRSPPADCLNPAGVSIGGGGVALSIEGRCLCFFVSDIDRATLQPKEKTSLFRFIKIPEHSQPNKD